MSELPPMSPEEHRRLLVEMRRKLLGLAQDLTAFIASTAQARADESTRLAAVEVSITGLRKRVARLESKARNRIAK